jgi:hypothetical protein
MTYAFGLNLAIDEGTDETSTWILYRKDMYVTNKILKMTYMISLALAWLSGLPFAATWFSYALAACGKIRGQGLIR